jgi:hypothetical protein
MATVTKLTNEHGVYIRGVEKVTIFMPKRARAHAAARLIRDPELPEGEHWRAGHDFGLDGVGVGSGGASAAPSCSGAGFATREAALLFFADAAARWFERQYVGSYSTAIRWRSGVAKKACHDFADRLKHQSNAKNRATGSTAKKAVASRGTPKTQGRRSDLDPVEPGPAPRSGWSGAAGEFRASLATQLGRIYNLPIPAYVGAFCADMIAQLGLKNELISKDEIRRAMGYVEQYLRPGSAKLPAADAAVPAKAVLALVPATSPETMLTAAEENRLADCEAKIAQAAEQAAQSYQQMGDGLEPIQSERLYRKTHATFEAYCQERLGIGRQQAYRFIAAARISRRLVSIGTTVLPRTESQVRPLMALTDPKLQVKVWQQATKLARAEANGREVQNVPARIVEAVVRERIGEPTATKTRAADPFTRDEAGQFADVAAANSPSPSVASVPSVASPSQQVDRQLSASSAEGIVQNVLEPRTFQVWMSQVSQLLSQIQHMGYFGAYGPQCRTHLAAILREQVDGLEAANESAALTADMKSLGVTARRRPR